MTLSSSKQKTLQAAMQQNPLDVGLPYSLWDEPNIERYIKQQWPQDTVSPYWLRKCRQDAPLHGAAYIVESRPQLFIELLQNLSKSYTCLYGFPKYLGRHVFPTKQPPQTQKPSIFNHGFFYFDSTHLVAYDYVQSNKARLTSGEWQLPLLELQEAFPECDYLALPYDAVTRVALNSLNEPLRSIKFIAIPASIYMECVPKVLVRQTARGFYKDIRRPDVKGTGSAAATTSFNVVSVLTLQKRLHRLTKEYQQKPQG